MRFSLESAGAPAHEHRHHRVRMVLSLVAALAGAVGILATVFLVIGMISPAEAAITWAAVAVLLAVWLSGIWWRWDSPDRRVPGLERERRGY
jgi:flagellar motor component MotA